MTPLELILAQIVKNLKSMNAFSDRQRRAKL